MTLAFPDSGAMVLSNKPPPPLLNLFNFSSFKLDPNQTSISNMVANITMLWLKPEVAIPITTAMAVYSYATPVLIVLGVLGNSLSLKIFLTKPMRKLEASVYLSALSLSDLAVLFCHVLVDWLRRGAPYLGNRTFDSNSIFGLQGVCQAQLYLSYVSRLLSSWIIVLFTVQRYVAVCHPLRRRGLLLGCRSSYKTLGLLLAASMALAGYKPFLTGRHEYRVHGRIVGTCGRDPAHPMLSFVLDSVFAMSITIVPFVVITVLNSLIIHKLYNRHRRIRSHVVTEESIVRMEFTIIFLIISFVFIALNLPFFCLWCNRFLKSFYNDQMKYRITFEGSSNEIYVMTRLIYYLNYAINFFLYSVSGACFRKELRMTFLFKKRQEYHIGLPLSNQSNMDGLVQTRHIWV